MKHSWHNLIWSGADWTAVLAFGRVFRPWNVWKHLPHCLQEKGLVFSALKCLKAFATYVAFKRPDFGRFLALKCLKSFATLFALERPAFERFLALKTVQGLSGASRTSKAGSGASKTSRAGSGASRTSRAGTGTFWTSRAGQRCPGHKTWVKTSQKSYLFEAILVGWDLAWKQPCLVLFYVFFLLTLWWGPKSGGELAKFAGIPPKLLGGRALGRAKTSFASKKQFLTQCQQTFSWKIALRANFAVRANATFYLFCHICRSQNAFHAIFGLT